MKASSSTAKDPLTVFPAKMRRSSSALCCFKPPAVKIADATGGYIQTEWIYDENASNNRCMIKIQILSADFISTGVKSKFLCENKNQEIWKTDGKEYLEEEKILTLQILEASQKYSSSALN